MLDDAR